MIKEYPFDLCFVILNYNIINETINCIDSIKSNIDTNNYKIILVDNGSEDQISNQLSLIYRGDDRVIFVKNSENLGFAKGNNVGIQKALSFEPKYVCCLNNDALLNQNDFFEVLDRAYNIHHDALIGPRVILRDGSVQSYSNRLKTLDEYNHDLMLYESALNGSKIKDFFRDIPLFYNIYHYLFNLINNSKRIRQPQVDPFLEKQNVILHGCCLIFTPIFFERLVGFNPDTFLYREEELLYLDVISNNLTTRYLPSIYISHLEDVSTNSINIRRSQKNHFYLKNQIDSLRVLIKKLETINQL